MTVRFLCSITAFSLAACAADPGHDPTEGFVELNATTILDAPSVDSADVTPQEREQIRRGKYMVELLGCGTCHTPGAFEGAPDYAASLAGSDVGIAYTPPQLDRYPGVIFPPNITPDDETGIGRWTDEQLDSAIRAGVDKHGRDSAPVMPWPGYAKLSDEDTDAIISYLRNLAPVKHQVPARVWPGEPTAEAFVYFGFYTTTE